MIDKSFKGFPDRADVIPVPNLFFAAILPSIKDLNELKTILDVFWLIRRKRKLPRFILFTELLNSSEFVNGLVTSSAGDSKEEIVKRCVNSAVKKGIFLIKKLEIGKEFKEVLFINMEPDKTYLNRILAGELVIPELFFKENEEIISDPTNVSSVYSLYEQNIGMITPIIADELRNAEENYPQGWITDAIKEAVNLNKRNWRYITSILDRWNTEGKSDGKIGRHFKKDIRRYTQGKYGHMVNR